MLQMLGVVLLLHVTDVVSVEKQSSCLGDNGEDLAKAPDPRLRDAFGLDRLMWGSDWPHTQFEDTQTYGKNRRILADLVVDDAERASVLTSARGLFRL